MDNTNDWIREYLNEKINDSDFVEWLSERLDTFKFVVYQGIPAMDANIDSLNLSVRAYRCLERAGYDTINSLVEDIDSREDLNKIRNLGRKKANEIMLELFIYTYVNLGPKRQKAYLNKVRSMN